MKHWTMAVLTASTMLAGCAALPNVAQGNNPAGGPRLLLDQYVSSDPFMIVSCVYTGWSQLGPNAETTSYDVPNTTQVKVYRGQGADGKPVYDPILNVVVSGYGTELAYYEAHPGKLPAAYQATVRRCMVAYPGSVY